MRTVRNRPRQFDERWWRAKGLETWRQASINPQIDTGYVTCRWAGEKSDRVGNLVQFSYSPYGNLGKHRQDSSFDILPWRVCIAQASLFGDFTESILQCRTAYRTRRNSIDRNSIPFKTLTSAYTGMTLLDINGLAGSIELYLGEDVLTVDGALSPVQWKGYSEALRAYHGEIMHKSQLQAAFWRKMELSRGDKHAMASADWSGIHAIPRTIFTAFD
jgi:hypothetical protein